MEYKIANKVIIIGGDHQNGLGIIRSLGEFGCKVFFIVNTNNKSFTAKSKYIKKSWYADSEEKILNILINQFGNDKLKPIIFPADDYSESVIDKNINRLKENFIFPSINEEENAVLKKMNKVTMNKLAEKHGFLIPKSFTLELGKIKNIDNAITDMDIKFPCIIKPLQSIDGTKSDISINKSSTVLSENLKKLKAYYNEVLIQEFIYKEIEVGVQGFAAAGIKSVIIPGVIEKLRQSTKAFGSATYAKLNKTSSFIDLNKVKSLVKDLNYTGIFDMDLIYSKGKVYFIELNFRNGAYGYAFTKAGINIPALWCLDAIGEDISNRPKEINNEVILMSETTDFKNVLEKKVTLLKWINEFIRSDVHLIINSKDLKPFIYKILDR